MTPRDYTAPTTSAGYGMPQERLARIAARRAFVEIKQAFLRAVDTLDDETAPWLQRQVRHAQEPEDLWLLRSAVFTALRRDPDNGTRVRNELRRSLDSVFPGTFFQSAFTSF